MPRVGCMVTPRLRKFSHEDIKSRIFLKEKRSDPKDPSKLSFLGYGNTREHNTDNEQWEQQLTMVCAQWWPSGGMGKNEKPKKITIARLNASQRERALLIPRADLSMVARQNASQRERVLPIPRSLPNRTCSMSKLLANQQKERAHTHISNCIFWLS